jgi:hypothetical protein
VHSIPMDQRQETAQLGPPVLSRLGAALRDMTKDAVQAEQPLRMRSALAALEQLEEREPDRKPGPTRRSNG